MSVIIGGKVMFADTRGPSSLKLDELADVTITSPVQGNFLAYNATTLEWQNRDIVATDLPASGVVPAFYGSSNTVPVITVDAAGRITAASSVPIATASETAFGLIEIATIPETTAGVDSSRAVTPAGVAAVTAALQPGDATLTGLSAVTTAADTLIYATGVDTFTSTGLTAFGNSGGGAGAGDIGNNISGFSPNMTYYVGAAGGKAINTSGNAVTWVSGSGRAFGVVG